MAKLEFFKKMMSETYVEKVPFHADLGIEIIHNGRVFNLGEDNYGKLYLSSQDVEMVILPRASNLVNIESKGN